MPIRELPSATFDHPVRRRDIGKTFTAAVEKYPENYQNGEGLRVIPAKLRTGDAETPQVPGVAVFTGAKLKFCITLEHAQNLLPMLTNVIEQVTPRAAARQG